MNEEEQLLNSGVGPAYRDLVNIQGKGENAKLFDKSGNPLKFYKKDADGTYWFTNKDGSSVFRVSENDIYDRKAPTTTPVDGLDEMFANLITGGMASSFVEGGQNVAKGNYGKAALNFSTPLLFKAGTLGNLARFSHGVRGLASPTGIYQTYKYAKEGHPWRAALSGAGDVFNGVMAASGVPTVIRGTNKTLSFINSPLTGKYTEIGNKYYRMLPGYAGANHLEIESVPKEYIPVTKPKSVKRDYYRDRKEEKELGIYDYNRSKYKRDETYADGDLRHSNSGFFKNKRNEYKRNEELISKYFNGSGKNSFGKRLERIKRKLAIYENNKQGEGYKRAWKEYKEFNEEFSNFYSRNNKKMFGGNLIEIKFI